MSNELIERLDLWIAEYDRPAYSQIVLLLKDCKKALEAKPSIDTLVAEIDGLERIYFDEGGCDYPCSDGDNYRFDDVRAVLGKYRRAK